MWQTFKDIPLGNRVTILEQNEYENEVFKIITSGTTGNVGKATHSIIQMDQYPNLGDCLILKVDPLNNRPIEEVVRDANGEVVVADLNAAGDYEITNEAAFTYPVAIVYQELIAGKYLSEIDPASIVNTTQLSTAKSVEYDNSTSGLEAFEVQSALDEIASKTSYLSAGVADPTPPIFIDNHDGTGTIASCNIYIYPTTNFTGTIKKFTVPSATLTFPVDSTRYIAVNYNLGVPVYEVHTSSTINGSNIVPVFKIWRQDGTLHSLDADSQGLGLSNKIANMIISTNPYSRAGSSGLIISEINIPIPRTVAVTGAYVYAGTTGIVVNSFNSSTDKLTLAYHIGGVWTYTQNLTYNNTQIDNGTNLVAIDNSKWAVRWFYRSIGDVNETFYVLGSASFNNINDARSALPRTDLPTILREHCMLIGRSIIQVNSPYGITETAFGVDFSGSAYINHNDTTDRQGGDTNEYYHLSKPEYDWVNNVQSATKDYTGFSDPSAVEENYDPTTRTVILTGTFTAYYRGQVVTALTNGFVSSAHAVTEGAWFLYYNGTSFVWSQTAWSYDMLQVASTYYTALHKFGIRECHGLMPHLVHQELHETIGTYKTAGGTLSSYTLASTNPANRRPDVSLTVIKDEDIPTTLPALTTKLYTLHYNTGTGTAVSNFTVGSADIIPLLGNNPYYNLFTSNTWTQTLMANNSYSSVWLLAIPVTSDAPSQKYRYVWIQGQTNNVTLANEQAIQSSSLNLGSITGYVKESVFLAKVIIRYTGGNWQYQQVDILSGTRVNQTSNPSGNFLSAVSTDLTLTGAGTTASPLGLASPNTYNTVRGVLAANTDLDLLTASGIYAGGVQTYNSNPFVGSNFVLNVFYYSVSVCVQEAVETGSIRKKYRLNYAGWSNWQELPRLDASNTFTAVYNIISGHQLTNGGGLELNYAGTGDRNAYIDFHSADSPADYSTRIIRHPGVNGILQIEQKGTNGISIEAPVVYFPNYTMLGPNDGAHPAIRKKLLTTTFPSSIVAFTLAHGLTLSKILSVVVVVYTGVYIIPPSYNNTPAYFYTWYSTAGDITINPSDAANLYGGTVKVIIEYIA